MNNPLTNRRGSALMYILLLFLIIPLGLLIFWVVGHHEGVFSVAGTPACTDFTKIDPAITCSADQDCITTITGGAPQDPNVQLRCNSSFCEAKLLQCGGEVGQ